jgi:hypothetical protein
MGGVHVDTGFHRRCPQGHDQSIRSAWPGRTIEPLGDRSRGLQLTVQQLGATSQSNLCSILRPITTPRNVISQDIGDTSGGLGGDTSAARLRRWLSMNPSILVSAWRFLSGPMMRPAARCRSPHRTHPTRTGREVRRQRKTPRPTPQTVTEVLIHQLSPMSSDITMDAAQGLFSRTPETDLANRAGPAPTNHPRPHPAASRTSPTPRW